MIFKLVLKASLIAVEIFLGFYSIVMSDSLLVKFIFFVFTAVLIALLLIKLTKKVLPVDKDFISIEQEEANLNGE